MLISVFLLTLCLAGLSGTGTVSEGPQTMLAMDASFVVIKGHAGGMA